MNYRMKSSIKKILFRNEILHSIYNFFGKTVKKHREKLSDEEFFIKVYKENTGEDLNLDNPVTFNDKLIWLSLHERNSLKTKCADKYLVREYVTQCGYPEILNTLYGVYENTNQINFKEMPDKFFIKTNHDSGTYALIDKNNPKTYDALKKIDRALLKNYYDESREWQYKNINPKIICEEYIETREKFGLVDYRFYCFEGKIGFIAVDLGTTDGTGKHSYLAKRNLYNSDFIMLNAKLKREHFEDSIIKKPDNFEKMKEIASSLSKPFKHVRVDLYNVNGKIIFGEMTFCNAGGMQLLEPEEFNKSMGNMINLENIL